MTTSSSSSSSKSGSALQDWVASVYYRHGLFCASNPRMVLLLAAACVLWACWPLFSVPIYGGEVKVFKERIRDLPGQAGHEGHLAEEDVPYWMHNVSEIKAGETETGDAGSSAALSTRRRPIAYIQQVGIRLKQVPVVVS